MTTYVDAMEARKSFGTLLDKAYYQNQATVIKRANKPMAVLLPYDFLRAIEIYDQELLASIKKTAAKNNLSYDKAMDLALEATKYARTKKD